jgi:YggU family uncharacterized protein
LVIGVAAAPERGRANAELIETVAGMAGVARSAVELIAGATARLKSLRISCADPTATAAKLAATAAKLAATAAKLAAPAAKLAAPAAKLAATAAKSAAMASRT